MTTHFLKAAGLDLGEQKKRQRRVRKVTLANVAQQASKAALEVARYEVRLDGTIVVVTGESHTGNNQQANELDNWLAKHAD